MVGTVPLDSSESLDDFSVLKLALERRRKSLKKGIVPANAFDMTAAIIPATATTRTE